MRLSSYVAGLGPTPSPVGMESVLVRCGTRAARFQSARSPIVVSAAAISTSLMPPRPRVKVHVTGAIPSRVSESLALTFELVDRPGEAEGILTLVTTHVDDTYLEACGAQLRMIANYGVGVDNIDVEAAKRREITVTNTPDVLTKATAEFAVALMLSLLRRVTEGDRLIRRGDKWEFALEFMLGESLEGKTVAIIGAGRIGHEVGRLVEPFGARPIYVRRRDPLDQVLGAADIVTLHCPLIAATHHLIDADALDCMTSSAVLINTARGPIVDEAALVRALRTGSIAGAALDVYEFEPQVAEELLSLENVVLSPHLGSATRSTREAMGMSAVESLKQVLIDGRAPTTRVL